MPGCGKAAEIIARVNWKTDLVLTPGREAAAMIRRRACALHKSPVATSDNVRTFDSFVMNRKIFKFDAVYVDEGLMVHTGLLNFALKISGCKKAFVFGDAKQIPFINRVTICFDYPKELRTLIVDNVERRYVTHRCPRDEFVILLENIESIDYLEKTISRIKSVSSKMPLLYSSSIIIDFSFSLGISLYPYDGDNVEKLLDKADKNMYLYKQKSI